MSVVKDKLLVESFLQDFWKIQRRGPDYSCFETFPNACVGFHRLSIMDKSFASNQPYKFQEQDRTVIFTMNGEIYNFKEIISKFQLDITINSDCKVVPLLYMKMTQEDRVGGYQRFLELFNREIKGEFAFTMLEFDHLNTIKKVIVGRDQIGIRPLYYSPYEAGNKHLLFSSEMKGMGHYDGKVNEFPPGHIYCFEIDEFQDMNIQKFNFKWVYKVEAIQGLSE